MGQIDKLIRAGKVVGYNAANGTARVLFPDTNMISGDLFVLKQGQSWAPQLNAMVLCLYLPAENGDGFVLGAV